MYEEIVGLEIMLISPMKIYDVVRAHTYLSIHTDVPSSGYFSGVKFSWFSWLANRPRNIYPRNIKCSYKATPINSCTYTYTPRRRRKYRGGYQSPSGIQVARQNQRPRYPCTGGSLAPLLQLRSGKPFSRRTFTTTCTRGVV